MIPRAIENKLLTQIDHKKAILIFGPRQVGKTTLVKDLMKKVGAAFTYFNGDEITTRNLWRKDQVPALIQSFGDNKMIVLDEAQMVEEVGSICKQIIDAELGIQLILTGSSALDIASLTQEPLTGRKWEYFLYPISCAEMIEYSGTPELLRALTQYLVYGCYPEVVTNLNNAKQILNNLASSYLYKDVLALTGVKKPLLLEKILKALAWQVGSEVSLNELARVVGADVKTVDSYIHLLEQVYVVYRLGAHSGNLRNEINRKKKIYFYDNGIRNALIGNYSLPDDRNDTGALWENYLMTERKKILAYHGFYGHTYFWRSKAQAEVDYLEEIDGKLYAYEFKWNPGAKSKFPQSFVEAYKPVSTEVIHRDNFWQWLKTYPY
ncbi:MAG TPA: ATP-binding protein [Puia sp.]|nr:ATP-binding protein [Puia sp.]